MEQGREVIVGASEGRYTVSAVLGDDEYYGLVGDRSAEGMISIVLGGQEADYPRRFLVSAEAAIDAALRFLSGSLPIPLEASWERQVSFLE